MNAIQAYAEPETALTSQARRVANLLSLTVPDDFDEVALARQVSKGLPLRSAKSLGKFFGGGKAIPLVPEATLRRARQQRRPLSKEHSERLYELGRVLDTVSTIYRGDTDRIIAFLTRSHPLLGGESPLDLARSSSAGADAVLKLIQRASAGVAV